MKKVVTFFDLEVNANSIIVDIGALRSTGEQFHKKDTKAFYQFLHESDFVCGHNIFSHDLRFLDLGALRQINTSVGYIDTLLLSPLLFPAKAYHKLVKDDKLDPENYNNPFNDAVKAKELLADEIIAFKKLPGELKTILSALLYPNKKYRSFFDLLGYKPQATLDTKALIASYFAGKVCHNAPLDNLIQEDPVALAYCLALINVNDRFSVFPPWLSRNFPVQRFFHSLRSKPCPQYCAYCKNQLDPHAAFERWYGFKKFRDFNGVPLQENAVRGALRGESLLAIFPTGGGKSITFQLPALMAGEAERGLTVIISPLQSLMKDQVDNLEIKQSITDAVTINGLLDPVERQKSIERVREGGANLLYISPESLRSNTIEKLLEGRHIARFVIDEAHCFSTWGQDFRVDYLYIGDFIRKFQEKKNLGYTIPVSCFTATAKQKVVEDIRKYFKDKLGLDLALYTTNASRTNLHYTVLEQEDDSKKYSSLRSLLEEKHCPTIIYVSRTKTAELIAERLQKDGFNANFYHGKMDVKNRVLHQNEFIAGRIDIMVATSAFGMGVDKSDVGMVIHYEISDSLENYVQEAGRAGRDEKISAECYVLFNEDDLNKHFQLLNRAKLTMNEIQEVWRAIRDLTRTRLKISHSALEIARKAGWDDEVSDVETRIATAIAALEDGGYVVRGNNAPNVFASGIAVQSAQEAIDRIAQTSFTPEEKTNAERIIKKLIAYKRSQKSKDGEAESRVDYIADDLGLTKETVIHTINLLKQEHLLSDAKDLTAYVRSNTRAEDNAVAKAALFLQIEEFLLAQLKEDHSSTFHLKELNEAAIQQLQKSVTPSHLKTLFNIWSIQGWIKKERADMDQNHYRVSPKYSLDELQKKYTVRSAHAKTVISYLFAKAQKSDQKGGEETFIEFSVQELQAVIQNDGLFAQQLTAKEVEDILFYLSRIEALKIEGGFMVLYNKLTIERKETNNKAQYKKEHYQKLADFYENKIQQIHIVGEYAQRMIKNYQSALKLVDDYFQLNHNVFLNKYFPGNRKSEIKRTLTRQRFEQLIGGLSLEQQQIVTDNESSNIVVAAGPGSGKTKVLVHKLASLLQIEDIKHEQLLMLTFSRAAATEFKTRLRQLIGNSAYYVEIKTFHSYCFDLLGRLGDIDRSKDVIREAIEKIKSEEIVLNRIAKAVLVIDEAQDVNDEEFELIKLLVEKNEGIRVLLVGDDDQNIFEWRKASDKCMRWFLEERKGKLYTLVDNYRSSEEVVQLANSFVLPLQNRLKDEPIISKRGPGGEVIITRYSCEHLAAPLINDVLQTELKGSTAVLARTNDEALLLAGALRDRGMPVKLIQSHEEFPLYNLLEIRQFSDLILGGDASQPKIDSDLYQEARRKISHRFAGSSKLSLVQKVIDAFYESHRYHLYKTDWLTFLEESRLEDFIAIDNETIYVSTIHKVKGKEFANLFVLWNGTYTPKDTDRRLLYVAFTRARQLLHIHYRGSFLPGNLPAVILKEDNQLYERMDSLSLQLTHHDVWLDFSNKQLLQQAIQHLMSGAALDFTPASDGCVYGGKTILRFSKAFQDALIRRLHKGFTLHSAKTEHLVYWKTSSGAEICIPLPELILQRSSQSIS